MIEYPKMIYRGGDRQKPEWVLVQNEAEQVAHLADGWMLAEDYFAEPVRADEKMRTPASRKKTEAQAEAS